MSGDFKGKTEDSDCGQSCVPPWPRSSDPDPAVVSCSGLKSGLVFKVLYLTLGWSLIHLIFTKLWLFKFFMKTLAWNITTFYIKLQLYVKKKFLNYIQIIFVVKSRILLFNFVSHISSDSPCFVNLLLPWTIIQVYRLCWDLDVRHTWQSEAADGNQDVAVRRGWQLW